MNRHEIEQLAQALLAGEISSEVLVTRLQQVGAGQGIVDVGEAQIDLDRHRRCGFPEVVFAEGKSVESLERIFQAQIAHQVDVLATRMSADKAAALQNRFPQAAYNPVGGTFRIPLPAGSRTSGPAGIVVVITAGTSDLPVAEEAHETAVWAGAEVRMLHDVGVAGPHRLRANLGILEGADAVVVVAGMEGALPSVVGGYVACPVIAVPTSVGYGAAFGGLAALLGMLNSCAANVTVVNIDAGFKGGYLAGLIARNLARGAEPIMSEPTPDTTPGGDDRIPRLALREPNDHKGTFGTALIVGGSRGMSGAAAMAGMSALRGGAGLVRMAVPEAILDTVAGFQPAYTTIPLPCDRKGRITLTARARIVAAAGNATVVGLGPGLGQSLGLRVLVAWLYEHLPLPMVIDADALNALAARSEVLPHPGGPRVLTPHPGEFARLYGRPVSVDERMAVADDAARRWGVIVVLKGHGTCVTDGRRRAVNRTGNPGMATGGTGDVLTGLITALACQNLPPWEAARLGVHLHGLAGDLAADQLGQVSLTASDLIDFLPPALRQVAAANKRNGK